MIKMWPLLCRNNTQIVNFGIIPANPLLGTFVTAAFKMRWTQRQKVMTEQDAPVAAKQ